MSRQKLNFRKFFCAQLTIVIACLIFGRLVVRLSLVLHLVIVDEMLDQLISISVNSVARRRAPVLLVGIAMVRVQVIPPHDARREFQTTRTRDIQLAKARVFLAIFMRRQ